MRIHEFGGPEVLRIEDALMNAPSNDPKVASLVFAGICPRRRMETAYRLPPVRHPMG